MRCAIIGDIHSNKFALESVIEDIKRRNVDFIVSTGDLVGYLPYPNEVIDMIRENRIISVLGNHDQRIANSPSITDDIINRMTEQEVQYKGSKAFTSWIITDKNRAYLKNLPTQIKLKFDKQTMILVHGSPRAINEYLYKDSDEVKEIAKTIDEDIIISGHTHMPYHVEINNKHFINAGSVGKPKDGTPEAKYIIIDMYSDNIKSEIISVGYDIASIIESIESNRMISNKLIEVFKQV